MNYKLDKEKVDAALFEFLQSVYLFEKRETAMFGISWDEVYLLQLLIREPGLCVSDIATKLKIEKFVASRMLTRLGEKSLVRRDASVQDKRSVKLYITSEGENKIAEIEEYNYNTVALQTENMTEQEMLFLLKSLEQLPALLNLKEDISD
jgi:DNA-binding MarR family transcriptional regulator